MPANIRTAWFGRATQRHSSIGIGMAWHDLAGASQRTFHAYIARIYAPHLFECTGCIKRTERVHCHTMPYSANEQLYFSRHCVAMQAFVRIMHDTHTHNTPAQVHFVLTDSFVVVVACVLESISLLFNRQPSVQQVIRDSVSCYTEPNQQKSQLSCSAVSRSGARKKYKMRKPAFADAHIAPLGSYGRDGVQRQKLNSHRCNKQQKKINNNKKKRTIWICCTFCLNVIQYWILINIPNIQLLAVCFIYTKECCVYVLDWARVNPISCTSVYTCWFISHLSSFSVSHSGQYLNLCLVSAFWVRDRLLLGCCSTKWRRSANLRWTAMDLILNIKRNGVCCEAHTEER